MFRQSSTEYANANNSSASAAETGTLLQVLKIARDDYARPLYRFFRRVDPRSRRMRALRALFGYRPPNAFADPRFEALRMFAIDRLIADRTVTDAEMLTAWRGQGERLTKASRVMLFAAAGGRSGRIEPLQALAA